MKNENPPLIVESIVSSLEAAIKAPPERIPIKETLMEETQAIDVVSHPKKIPTTTVEIGDPLEQVIPIQCLPQPFPKQALYNQHLLLYLQWSISRLQQSF